MNSLLFSMVHNVILFNLTVFCFTFYRFYFITVKSAQLLNCTPHPFSQCHESSYKINLLLIYYLHIPMNALCPIALNVEFFSYSAIIIIVLKLNPCRSEIILFVIRNPNNAL